MNLGPLDVDLAVEACPVSIPLARYIGMDAIPTQVAFLLQSAVSEMQYHVKRVMLVVSSSRAQKASYQWLD
jgi:hypothetical protein